MGRVLASEGLHQEQVDREQLRAEQPSQDEQRRAVGHREEQRAEGGCDARDDEDQREDQREVRERVDPSDHDPSRPGRRRPVRACRAGWR